MVKTFFKLLYTEISGLHQAAFLIGFSAFLSQILALFRDRLLASNFGAGQVLDIYYTAFRIPDLVYVTIASFVAVTVLVPFILNLDANQGRKEVENLINKTFSLFCVVMILASVILFILMPYLAPLVAPGFDKEALTELILMSRILLLSPFLLGISNLFGSVTQAFQKFYAYTLSPLLYNAGIIVGILFFYPKIGNAGLVWGVVFGAFLHMLIQLPALLQSNILPSITFKFWDEEVKGVVLTSLPRTLTLASHQITIVVLVAMATLFAEGSVSVFNFAFNLQSVPLAIIGVSYSVAAFPSLAKFLAIGEMEKFKKQMLSAIRHIIFWSLPVIVLFIVLRAQIVRVILGAGEFGWTETRLTAAALALFVLSVLAQNLVQLFIRAYYAKGETIKPLLINVFSAFFIIATAFFLVDFYQKNLDFQVFFENLLRVDGISETVILMLPLSFSLGLLLNLFLYWHLFQKDFGRFDGSLILSISQSLMTALFAGLITQRFLVIFANYFDLNSFIGIFSQGFLSGLIGIIFGFSLLLVLENKELLEIKTALKRRRVKKVIYPEQEEL